MTRNGRGRSSRRGTAQKGDAQNTRALPSRSAGVTALQGYAQQSNSHQYPQLSLSQEARNTELHQTLLSDSQATRHSLHTPVNFVAAGSAAPEDLTHVPHASQALERTSSKKGDRGEDPAAQQDLAQLSINDKQGINGMAMKTMLKMDKDARVSEVDQSEANTSSAGFFIDSIGSSEPVKTGLPPPSVRSASPTASDSGDEVIVFLGRNTKKSQTLDLEVPTRLSSPSFPNDANPQAHTTTKSTVQEFLANVGPSMPMMATREETQPSKSKKRLAQRKSSSKYVEEDLILADYIANMQGNDGANEVAETIQFKRRDLGLDGWEDEGLVADDATDEKIQDDDDEWDSMELQDFDGFSTSSEPMDTIPRILAKRVRKSVVQYLVVSEGDSMDEARWLPVSLLKASGAAGPIALFEEEQVEFEHLMDENDASDDSLTLDAQLAMDLEEDLEALEDEEDLEERRKACMTDEQIARLLSKQAELGIVGDELVLFNGDGLTTNCSNRGRAGPSRKKVPTLSQYTLRSKGKTKKRPSNAFPSATLFADVLEQDPYNGFDIMDQERPSLRKKPKKGRRSETMFDISDSDLQQSLNAAWETDRTKKRLRKQEREELRAQGLLGKKGKPDLKAKFSEGMSINDLKSEIKDFLRSSVESLPLPPMGHKERKDVHSIANMVGLKSKSVGAGTSRFPTLYKTAHTQRLTPEFEARIDAMSPYKTYLPRLDRAPRRKGTQTTRGRGGGGGGIAGAASYRDGEVVGIGAPELGVENKGRAILEKMGWSTGTALGALNNKGIAQPITQVVKTSKAGLG